MQQDRSLSGDVRANALWGRRGESRANALWGRTGKRSLVLLSLAAMFVVPVAGSAASGPGGDLTAVVPAGLIAQATANPLQNFDVIVTGNKDRPASQIASDVTNENGKLKRRFLTVNGVNATVSGKDLLKLARNSHVLSIVPNAKVKATGYEDATMWQDSTDLTLMQNAFNSNTGEITGPAPQAPAIAIVDSGVEARSDFGTRLVASITMCTLCPAGASGDDEGHGTMVAGVAAGSGKYLGGSPTSPIVSIRTANADGQSMTSDVIAAADWISAHAREYNIRVVNFSLAGASETSVRVDPLDKAVERLWLDGIVVVAAAGNHGSDSGPVSMSYAPGNDPFVITVGATDQHMTADPTDDTVPGWSAHGTTMDGFSKPDLSAPGRYMLAAAPMNGTIAKTVPDRVLSPGYMWMSGTSFATPVVSAAAAQILARNPSWTPDQVKGALMLTSTYLPSNGGYAAGVGEIDAAYASTLDNPPNPNVGLYQFVRPDAGSGLRVFDSASWGEYLASGASWAQASWGEASWGEASWNAASWGEASWNAASWVQRVDTMMSMASLSESTFNP